LKHKLTGHAFLALHRPLNADRYGILWSAVDTLEEILSF
jgi:hypothetical protein